jgi:hypothetical protein
MRILMGSWIFKNCEVGPRDFREGVSEGSPERDVNMW